jgi:hypothetical protein
LLEVSRASLHGYNTEAEIDTMIAVLRRLPQVWTGQQSALASQRVCKLALVILLNCMKICSHERNPSRE